MKTHCVHGHDKRVAGRDKRGGCAECARLRTTKWRNANKDYVKTENARQKTRLTAEFFGVSVEEILERRLAPCEICGSMGEERYNIQQCHVDHDHQTGKLRGSLCASCNLGLGKFKDSEELLASAVNYLRKYRATT